MISNDQIAMEFYDEGSENRPPTFMEQARSKLITKRSAVIFVLICLIIMIASLTAGLREQALPGHFNLTDGHHAPPPFYHTAFIFELNRHGARAPFWDNPQALQDFPVSIEMLSPQGMRQRMLLGRTLEKIVKKPTDVYVESTDVYRTIQSAYSQLSGVMQEQPLIVPKLKKQPKVPFKVRNSRELSESLDPVVPGFIPIPVYNYMNTESNDLLSADGCSYSRKSYYDLKENNRTFKAH